VGTKLWSLQLDRVAKMAGSHVGTCRLDLLQGLVPSCVPTFKLKLKVKLSLCLFY